MNEQTDKPAQELEIVTPSALEAMERANVDMLVSTAKRYPRDIQKSKRAALAIITLDPDTASECFYKLERGGKTIMGPSVRLAEVVASTWGNIRAGSRTISETDTVVVAQGFCHDTENNVFVAKEVERRCVDKNGRKYNVDVLTMTKNANCSIALRNAVFSVVPRAVVNVLYDEAVRAAVGDIKTLSERVTKAMAKLAAIGISQDRVFQKLKIERMDEFTPELLENLFGLYTAIKDEEATPDEAFPAIIKKGLIGKQEAAGQASTTNASTAANPATPEDNLSDEQVLAELHRRMGVDGVTEAQTLGYCRLKEVKLATDKQVELLQLSPAKHRQLLAAWSSIIPNIRKVAV